MLVGINQYPVGISNLYGCVQDVQALQDLLISVYSVPSANIVVLTDDQANRENVIRVFRSHFQQARPGDTLFFHYSGHGSRESAPSEFWPYFPEKKNETLVLSDSRSPGGLDLADKELAILLHELAPLQANIVLNIDACHSGSITRSENDLLKQPKRQTEKSGLNRGLGDYLEGQYQIMQTNDGTLNIPRTKHLVMSACSSFQSAYETKNNQGAFTTALLASLQDPTLSYAEVFSKANIKIKQWAYHQNPTLYPAEGFNTFARFLTQEAAKSTFYPAVYFEQGQWNLEMGAVQGIPADAKVPGVLDIQAPDTKKILGKATIQEVLTNQSILTLDDQSQLLDSTKIYQAHITHLPIDKMQVHLFGDQADIGWLISQFEQENSTLLDLSQNLPRALYQVACTSKHYAIYENATAQLIYKVTNSKAIDKKNSKKPAIHRIIELLEHLAHWYQIKELQNHSPKIPPNQVSFYLEQQLIDGHWQAHPLQATFYLGSHQGIAYRLIAQNDRYQVLYANLIQLTEMFQIKLIDQVTLPPKTKTIIKEKADWVMHGGLEKTMTYLLLISTEPLHQPIIPFEEGIHLGHTETLRSTQVRGLASRLGHRRYPTIKNDWFTHLMQMKIAKPQGEVPGRGQYCQPKGTTFKLAGHPSLRANLALESTFRRSRTETAQALKNALQSSGWEVITLLQQEVKDWVTQTKQTESLEILTLYDIANPETVNPENPLVVELEVGLESDETLLAFSFYGQQVFCLGETTQGHSLSLTKLVTDPQNAELCQICFAKGQKANLEIDWE